jgi:hypothetical protein
MAALADDLMWGDSVRAIKWWWFSLADVVCCSLPDRHPYDCAVA